MQLQNNQSPKSFEFFDDAYEGASKKDLHYAFSQRKEKVWKRTPHLTERDLCKMSVKDIYENDY